MNSLKKAAKGMADLIKKFWEAFKNALFKFVMMCNNIVKHTGLIALVTSMVMAVVSYIFEEIPEIQTINNVIQCLFGIYIVMWILINVDQRWAHLLEK